MIVFKTDIEFSGSEIEVEVSADYSPPQLQTFNDPPFPAHLELVSIKRGTAELLNLVDPDTLESVKDRAWEEATMPVDTGR